MSGITFRHHVVIDRLSSKVEAVTHCGNLVLIANKDGQLLLYRIVRDSHGRLQAGIDEVRTGWLRVPPAPVSQLLALPELDQLVAVAGGRLFISRLSSQRGEPPASAAVFEKFARVSTFAARREGGRYLMAVAHDSTKLAIVEWLSGAAAGGAAGAGWVATRSLKLPEAPKAMCWAGSTAVCVGFKSRYDLVDVSGGSGRTQELAQSRGQPCVLAVDWLSELLISAAQVAVSLSLAGAPTRGGGSLFSGPPSAFAAAPPYVAALLTDKMSAVAIWSPVRSSSPATPLPQINIPGAELLSCPAISDADAATWRTPLPHPSTSAEVASITGPGPQPQGGLVVVVSATSALHVLDMLPFDEQVSALHAAGEYEEALGLAKIVERTPGAVRESVLGVIRASLGVKLWGLRRYQEAIEQLKNAALDPRGVLALIPALLPKACVETWLPAHYSQLPPALPSTQPLADVVQQEQVAFYLLPYLDTTRKEAAAAETAANALGAREAVDTALLKALILRKEFARVRELCRDPKCYAVLEDAERALRGEERLDDFVALLRTRGAHDRALDILSKVPDGSPQIVEYVRALNSGPTPSDPAAAEALRNLIIMHSFRILGTVSVWRSVFRMLVLGPGETPVVPYEDVLANLDQRLPDALDARQAFLEMAITDAASESPPLHRQLADTYARRIARFKPSDPARAAALANFLTLFVKTSKFIVPAEVLFLLHRPEPLFLEAKAQLHAKLGQYAQALELLAHEAKSQDKALQICTEAYGDGTNPKTKGIFDLLVQVYLRPENTALHTPRPDLALDVLENHADRVDALAALQLLPADTPLPSVAPWLSVVLAAGAQRRRSRLLDVGLCAAARLDAHSKLVRAQRLHTTVERATECQGCRREIGPAIICRYPSGAVVHDNPKCRSSFESSPEYAATSGGGAVM